MKLFLLLDVLCCVFLSILAIQDFKSREIWLIHFPILAILFLTKALTLNGWQHILQQLVMNLLFVAFQLGCVYLFFRIKRKKHISIINQYIGLGDVLFFMLSAMAFSTVNYVVYFLFSLVFSILLFSIIQLKKKESNYQIPLAGNMAVVLQMCIAMSYLIKGFSTYNDYSFIALFIPDMYGI